MELLQVFQHSWLAVPEDGYAMCQHPVNVVLTYLGGIHIAFQPFFLNWALMGLQRRHNLRDRIESDLIQKLQFLGAIWILAEVLTPFIWPELAPPATKECPDHNWMQDGYDHTLDFTTPNQPGFACTYLSPTTNGHLAWVFPQMPGSYYSPGSSIHFFLMFACHLVLFRTRPLVAIVTFFGFLTGPVLAAWLTPSVNEQGAVWCFNACIQMTLIVLVFRKWGVPEELPPSRIVHEGKQGEPTLVYVRATSSNLKNESERTLLSTDHESDSCHSD